MPRENIDKLKQEEGFLNFGKLIRNVKKNITSGVTDFFMKPINSLKDFFLQRIRSIEDIMRNILCFALFLQQVFVWCSKTILTITKYVLVTPRCFVIWFLDSVVQFLQFIIIDIMMNLVLQPAFVIGKALNYPFVEDIKITGKNRRNLYENTNVIRSVTRLIDKKMELEWKIQPTCFGIEAIQPFPKYYS